MNSIVNFRSCKSVRTDILQKIKKHTTFPHTSSLGTDVDFWTFTVDKEQNQGIDKSQEERVLPLFN